MPNPTRTLQPLSPRHDRPVRVTLEQDIGVESIVEALEFKTFTDSPDDPPSRERQLLDRLSDPTFAGRAITTLMKEVGILLPELLDLLRKRDIALAVAHSGRRVGAVLEGLGEFAEPRWEICAKCAGEGEVEDPDGQAEGDPDDGEEVVMPTIRCLAAAGGCDGSGKVRRMGNLDAAKLFLETQGLRKGAGGGAPTVNVDVRQQQNNLPGAAGDRKAQQQEALTSRVQQALENGGGGNNGGS